MFTYCPLDVTILLVSISVFQWLKCCVSCNSVFYLFFWLRAPFYIYCQMLDDVPVMLTHVACWVLDLSLLLLNFPILPLGLSYMTMSGIFLYLLMIFQGCSRIIHALVYFWVLLSFLSQILGLSWFLIFWAAVSCFVYFSFIRLASFAESIWLSWQHIPALIWSARLCLA